jgi:hypothetical protein
MSKNIENLLKALGIEDVTELSASLLSDEENPETLDAILKSAQSYSKPFIESELSGKFNEERKSLKGKYLKEGLLKANKAFGGALTNKEIDDVLNDPANDGKTYDVAIELLKTKVSNKLGTSEHELQKMLDTANGKLLEYETKLPELETKYKNEATEAINKFKLDGVITEKLLKVLDGKTSIAPTAVAELIRGQLSNKALLRLKEDGNIGLYDLVNTDTPLKKNDTTLQTFEGLVDDLVENFGLGKKSNGTEHKQAQTGQQQQNDKIQTGATGLAAKLASVVAS